MFGEFSDAAKASGLVQRHRQRAITAIRVPGQLTAPLPCIDPNNMAVRQLILSRSHTGFCTALLNSLRCRSVDP
jgi:hypothetical protein